MGNRTSEGGELVNSTIIKNVQAVSNHELELINQYTRRPFTADEIYTFSVMLCDNEIDRDFERFDTEALKTLSQLFLGKTGIFDHNMKTGNQAARIYDTMVETDSSKKTSYGEPYTRVVAKAYLPRCEKNNDLIMEIESGMKKEVSVGCAVAQRICSICGADHTFVRCNHKKGKTYTVKGTKTVCSTILCHPTDAYEWSFVAVPAQRKAGVIKMFKHKKGAMHLEQILKSMQEAEDGLFLTSEEIETIIGHMEQMKEMAACGKAYREDVSRNVIKLCGLAQPLISADVMKRVTENMSLEDLKIFEKAFRAKAEEIMPLRSQLAGIPVKESATGKQNQAFKI